MNTKYQAYLLIKDGLNGGFLMNLKGKYMYIVLLMT